MPKLAQIKPEKFMQGLQLEEIWIYPVKSMGGIRVPSAKVLGKGLQYDRRWMLIDDDGIFLTQRTHPMLCRFKLKLTAGGIDICHENDAITLPAVTHVSPSPIRTRVFDDPVLVNEVTGPYSEWISTKLKTPCRLVLFPEEHERPVNLKYQVNNEQVSLADGFPFLVIGMESLNDLNRRLNRPLPMNRFRPNLVFSGGMPFEEDTWGNFLVGDNRFVGVKPCGRCAVTTVNQDTGEKGIEPLATLATFRKQGGNVYFGQNAIAIDHGEIKEGDAIVPEYYRKGI